VLLAALSAGGACTSDRGTIETRSVRNPPHVDGLKPYPEHSIGRDASEYSLTMARVREWYAVMGEVNELAKSDSSLHVWIEYSLASPIAPHINELQRLPGMVAVLERHQMSTKEFVLLATLINTGWGALALIDSLGPAATPINVGPSLIELMRSNRRELDSLRAQLVGR
jgi:hypothetical protein